jgi:hypothetical protein
MVVFASPSAPACHSRARCGRGILRRLFIVILVIYSAPADTTIFQIIIPPRGGGSGRKIQTVSRKRKAECRKRKSVVYSDF